MTVKEKFLLVLVLVVLVFGFFFRHFWGCTVYALQKAVALSFIPPPGLVKLAAVIGAVHFVL